MLGSRASLGPVAALALMAFAAEGSTNQTEEAVLERAVLWGSKSSGLSRAAATPGQGQPMVGGLQVTAAALAASAIPFSGSVAMLLVASGAVTWLYGGSALAPQWLADSVGGRFPPVAVSYCLLTFSFPLLVALVLPLSSILSAAVSSDWTPALLSLLVGGAGAFLGGVLTAAAIGTGLAWQLGEWTPAPPIHFGYANALLFVGIPFAIAGAWAGASAGIFGGTLASGLLRKAPNGVEE